MKKRMVWLDILKIIACFCVIYNHVGNYLFEYSGYCKGTVLFYSFFLALCKIGVPIFLMVSGYLLLGRNDSYKKCLKRCLRVFLPLLILSCIYYYVNNPFSIKGFLYSFISSDIRTYLWYIYMIIIFYLFTPLLQKLIKVLDNKDYLMLFILCFIIPGSAPFLSKYLDLNISRDILTSLIPATMCYYIFGNYLGKVKLCRKYFITSIIMFIVTVILLSMTVYIPYVENNVLEIDMCTCDNLLTILSSLSIFYIMRYLFSKKNFKEKTGLIISTISGTTFGIYLLHNLVSYRIYNSGIIQSIFKFNNYLGITSLVLACFILCGIVIYILKKIPIVKNYL